MLPPSIRSGSLWLYRAKSGRGSCSVRVWWAAEQPCVLYKGMNHICLFIGRIQPKTESYLKTIGGWLREGEINVEGLAPDKVCSCVSVFFRNWKKFLTCPTKAKKKTAGKRSRGEFIGSHRLARNTSHHVLFITKKKKKSMQVIQAARRVLWN